MKRIIPPVLFLLCIALMIGIRTLVVVQNVISPPFNYAGIALILLGIAVTVKVRKRFSRADTEIHTFKKPRKLVMNGLFRISRNPIYLGFTVSLIGVWVLLGTLLPIVGCLIFVLVTNYQYIPYEEKTMEQVFGDEYKVYRSKVRRWI